MIAYKNGQFINKQSMSTCFYYKGYSVKKKHWKKNIAKLYSKLPKTQNVGWFKIPKMTVLIWKSRVFIVGVVLHVRRCLYLPEWTQTSLNGPEDDEEISFKQIAFHYLSWLSSEKYLYPNFLHPYLANKTTKLFKSFGRRCCITASP